MFIRWPYITSWCEDQQPFLSYEIYVLKKGTENRQIHPKYIYAFYKICKMNLNTSMNVSSFPLYQHTTYFPYINTTYFPYINTQRISPISTHNVFPLYQHTTYCPYINTQAVFVCIYIITYIISSHCSIKVYFSYIHGNWYVPSVHVPSVHVCPLSRYPLLVYPHRPEALNQYYSIRE